MAQPFIRHWLFVRGMARERRHWHSFPEVFKAINPGTDVTCLDLPGFGKESRRSSPGTICDIVEDVRDRWLKVRNGDEHAWGILAISLGGMAALDWVARYPQEFRGAVIMNTSAANLSPFYHRFRPGVLAAGLGALTALDSFRREKLILGMTSNLQRPLEPFATTWAAYANETGFSRQDLLLQLLAGMKWELPDSIQVPTLFLTSEKDRLTHPECVRRIAKHFGAECRTHPEAGHDLPLDDPEWIANQVADVFRNPHI